MHAYIVTDPVGRGCPKCGTIKGSKKLSCCAPGGSWVKKCGNDAKKFDHTWAEGLKICKGKLTACWIGSCEG